jgi:nucleotide-binding universal stress UspA family protein
MPTSLTIVCAVDFSDHSKVALGRAVVWTEQFRARLIVTTVVDSLLAKGAAAAYNIDLARDEVLPELRDFVTKTVTERGLTVPSFEAIVPTGEPAIEILELARRESAGLIVVATHGLSGYRKMFLGSTTEKVLRHSDVPVLVAPPPEQTPTRDRSAGEVDPVLAPVDFKSESIRIVRAAAGIARTLRAPLVVAHVVAPLKGIERLRSHIETYNRTQIGRAEQQMQQLVSEAALKEPVETVVVAGSPADEIAQIAVARTVGLIVMGLRGEEGLLGSRPGSIAYRVLRLTPAMALTLPADRARSEWLERL